MMCLFWKRWKRRRNKWRKKNNGNLMRFEQRRAYIHTHTHTQHYSLSIFGLLFAPPILNVKTYVCVCVCMERVSVVVVRSYYHQRNIIFFIFRTSVDAIISAFNKKDNRIRILIKQNEVDFIIFHAFSLNFMR